MKIIGLCGEKGSGKDTICELLSKIYNVKRFAFADPLKDALKDLFLWDDSNFSREKKEINDDDWGVSPRQMCQILGTDVIRNLISDKFNKIIKIGDNEYTVSFWIKRIHKELEKLLSDSDQNYDYVIFTDVRFLDELLYIKNLGGEVFKVIRHDVEMNEYSKHEAERGIDGEEFNKCVDNIISNNGTIDELFEKIKISFKH
tara:strand:+ start:582 stop:1184 length:603 start_codon:yes stop_codon:yes gene_type:complete